MTQKDKDAVIAALEEYKGDSIGLITATIEDCQRVVREMAVDDGWIPVTERLPEQDLPYGSQRKQIKVLTAIRNDNGTYTIRSQLRIGYFYWNKPESWGWKYSAGEVTHWMPLPEPPEV